MELMPSPDFFESLDFNFLTAEIFQEHEFDWTLTESERMPLEWHGSDNEECDAAESNSRADDKPVKCEEQSSDDDKKEP